MKKFRFPPKIHTVHIPFLLHDLSPWQDQVDEQLEKFYRQYTLGKKHYVGFSITRRDFADIIVTR